MQIAIDTARDLSATDRAILNALLGITASDATETPVAPPIHEGFDLLPAAKAFIQGYSRHIETASSEACLRVAVEECRGYLPGPLSLPDSEIVRVAARIFLDDTTNRTLTASAWLIVEDLAKRCLRPAPPTPAAVPAPGGTGSVRPATLNASTNAPGPGASSPRP